MMRGDVNLSDQIASIPQITSNASSTGLMLTTEKNDFTQFLRKIRKDNHEVLGDMASKLGISSAFLSRVENGLTQPSERLISGVIEVYKLTGKEKNDFEAAGYALRNNNLFDLSRMPVRVKKLMVSISRNASTLSDEQITSIYEIMNGKEE